MGHQAVVHSGIICKIAYILFCLLFVQFLEFQLHAQFRHLPQLGVPQLVEDVVGEDPNECFKYYGDRSS